MMHALDHGIGVTLCPSCVGPLTWHMLMVTITPLIQRSPDLTTVGSYPPWFLDGFPESLWSRRYKPIHAAMKDTTGEIPLVKEVLHLGVVPIVTSLRPLNGDTPPAFQDGFRQPDHVQPNQFHDCDCLFNLFAEFRIPEDVEPVPRTSPRTGYGDPEKNVLGVILQRELNLLFSMPDSGLRRQIVVDC